MDKRYQVFVSSTYEDLQEARKEVMQALLELDCIPAGMELFPASNDDQWTLIKRVIDDCDYYILIIGGRYGSLNEEGISYTQMEFEYAMQTGKPIISFIHKNPDALPSAKVEKSAEGIDKLNQFKEKAKKKLIRYWETPADLGSVVSRSMIRLIKDYPAEGWVKAGSVVDTESAKEIARLQKENRELTARLNSSRQNAPAGTEKLAQGEDLFDLSFNLEDSDDPFACETYVLPVSWNTLLSIIGPVLLKRASETDIRNVLAQFLIEDRSKISQFKTKFGLFPNSDTFATIHDNVLQTILFQFRALGIAQLELPSELWRLTEYGDFLLMQAVALKKQ